MRKKLICGKKGGDKVLSLYWFVILTIIAGGVVLMVNAFYGEPYDVRDLESEILATKVADCIYSGGKMNPELIGEQGILKPSFQDNFAKVCSLNFYMGGEFVKEQYYVGVNFFESEAKNNVMFQFEAGNYDYIVDCMVEGKKEKLATCYLTDFWIVSPTGKPYFVELKSIVAKTDQNTK